MSHCFVSGSGRVGNRPKVCDHVHTPASNYRRTLKEDTETVTGLLFGPPADSKKSRPLQCGDTGTTRLVVVRLPRPSCRNVAVNIYARSHI